MHVAKRVADLQPYASARLAEKARAAGAEVLSLGAGSPDLPTPDFVVEELARAARDPATHCYPDFFGLPAFRAAVASFYWRRFGVRLDPDTEVLPLIGSKEGIAHLPWALVDPGDPVLLPAPGYPVYLSGTLLAGGRPVDLPLTEEHGWFPDLARVDPAVARRASIVWLNYPANPTGAVATLDQLSGAIRFAADHDLLIAYDNTYSELTYDGFTAPSILAVPGAREVAVEFGSLSKTFSMAGWRIGWLVGNRLVVEAVGRLKTNIDSGVFTAIQRAGIAALDSGLPHLRAMVAAYQRRRDRIMSVAWDEGRRAGPPRGGLYAWLPVPAGTSADQFSEWLLDVAGVLVTPGTVYGPSGEGYVRLSLAVPDPVLEAGCERIRAALASSASRAPAHPAPAGPAPAGLAPEDAFATEGEVHAR